MSQSRFPGQPSAYNPDHYDEYGRPLPPPAYTVSPSIQKQLAVASKHKAKHPTVGHSDSDSSDDDHDHKDGELHAHCAKAREALTRYGIPKTHHARICIVLDVSNSMDTPNKFYISGKIQKAIKKLMAIAMELGSGEKHSVTIFPFGKIAHKPVIIEEHDIENAVEKVMQSINHDLAPNTNYHAAVKKVRQHYFDHSDRLNAASPCEEDPVLAFFLTDGEPNMEETDALNQFRWAQHNAIYFKFIGLRGMSANTNEPLTFESIQQICNNPPKQTFLENRSYLLLNEPSELKIETLFDGYRSWLEEAHEHGVLVNDPGVKLDKNNPHDKKEIERLARLDSEHGHEGDVGSRHGHLSSAPVAVSSNRHASFKQPGEKKVEARPAQQNEHNKNCLIM